MKKVLGWACLVGGGVAIVGAAYWSYVIVRLSMWAGGAGAEVYWVNISLGIFVVMALSVIPLIAGVLLLKATRRVVDDHA